MGPRHPGARAEWLPVAERAGQRELLRPAVTKARARGCRRACRLLMNLVIAGSWKFSSERTDQQKLSGLFVVSQQISQSPAHAMQGDADGVLGHVHALRKLAMAPATKRVQRKHFGLFLGEPG